MHYEIVFSTLSRMAHTAFCAMSRARNLSSLQSGQLLGFVRCFLHCATGAIRVATHSLRGRLRVNQMRRKFPIVCDFEARILNGDRESHGIVLNEIGTCLWIVINLKLKI